MTKAQKYKEVLDEIRAVIAGETSITARYATASCLLAQRFDYFYWTGFYEVDPLKKEELVVGPYQGTLGCLRIPFSRGVCGACATQKKSLIVDDVEAFDGHVACDSRTKSEIVVPVFDKAGVLQAVLDVDSTSLNSFDLEDQKGLEAIAALLHP